MIQINWTQFKNFLDTKQLRARCIAIDGGYQIHGADQGLIYTCTVMDGEADHTDFVDNYKDGLEAQEAGGVTTRMEVDYLTLKLAKMAGQADANGNLVLSLDVPGTLGTVSRYIAGGYASTDNYAFGDAVTAVEVCDDANGTYSGNPNAVLRTYHDDDVDAANAGWFFWKSHGTEGEVEIEPVGYYGQLYAGMVLKVTFKVQANAKVNAIIWWGSKDQ